MFVIDCMIGILRQSINPLIPIRISDQCTDHMAQKSKSTKSSVSREDRLFAVKYLIDNKLSYTQCVKHLKKDFPEKYGGDNAVTTSDLAVWKSRHKNQDVSVCDISFIARNRCLLSCIPWLIIRRCSKKLRKNSRGNIRS